jgi:steroid delta-isomerase-like uncharacterized protein
VLAVPSPRVRLSSGEWFVEGWAWQYVDAFDSHQGARLAALVASDVQWEDVAAGIVFDSPAALAAFVAVSDAFSNDYRFTLVSEHVSETRYAVEWEMAGTNTGAFRGASATNRPFRLRGVSIGTFDAEGKVKENRDYYNVADLVQQLGLSPASGRDDKRP